MNRHVRKFSTTGKLGKTKPPHNETISAKPFADIPGPKGPFGMGTMYKYLPGLGSYRWDELHKACYQKYKQWGDIVRETIVPGVIVVWLFDPNDIAKVLNESGPGIYPQRRSHLALDKYRKDRPHIYNSGGLLPTNGPEWWRIRSEFQKGLSSPKHIRNMLPDMDEITKEFVANIRVANVDDFMPELARLNLEIICYLAFDVRMNGFTNDERHAGSITSRLIESAETTNSCILPLDQGLQLWRYYETRTYRKLRRSQEFMESIALDLVSQKISHYQDESSKQAMGRADGTKSMLEEYLFNPKLDLPDVVGMASDLLLAGIDTTTYTTCFLFYHLAKNPKVQQRLYEETCCLLPHLSDALEATKLSTDASYARAILKESLRLNPISVGVGRNLNTDMVLGGYNVPKGTVAVTQNMIACRLPKHFRASESFLPDRWLRDAGQASINPYLVLPFGHGMRACIARRLAEQSMMVLMIRVVREFEISWAGSENMDVKTHLINKPDQPVRIKFKRRTN